MDYELAKELEDAGYPVGYGDSDTPGIGWVPNLEAREYSKTYMTGFSLSELIEACEPTEKWAVLLHLTDKVQTAAKQGVTGQGTTPEEAVANLWLALNSTHSE